MKNMNDLVQQAQLMQQKITRLQRDMAERNVTATAGGGMVTATVNGVHEVVALQIEREIINPDEAEMLTDLVLAAVNEAMKMSQEMAAREMSKITGGFNLPGLSG